MSTVLNIVRMIAPAELAVGLVGLFVTIQVLKLFVNPNNLVQPPNSDDSMDVVDRWMAQSVGLFAIVLVIIQFVLSETQIGEMETLAVTALIVSAMFLMAGFILELYAGWRMFAFNLQLSSIRYAGLMLFTGLWFLLLDQSIPSGVTEVFKYGLFTIWVVWGIHELHYILIIGRRNWRSHKITRRTWLKLRILSWTRQESERTQGEGTEK